MRYLNSSSSPLSCRCALAIGVRRIAILALLLLLQTQLRANVVWGLLPPTEPLTLVDGVDGESTPLCGGGEDSIDWLWDGAALAAEVESGCCEACADWWDDTSGSADADAEAPGPATPRPTSPRGGAGR